MKIIGNALTREYYMNRHWGRDALAVETTPGYILLRTISQRTSTRLKNRHILSQMQWKLTHVRWKRFSVTIPPNEKQNRPRLSTTRNWWGVRKPISPKPCRSWSLRKATWQRPPARGFKSCWGRLKSGFPSNKTDWWQPNGSYGLQRTFHRRFVRCLRSFTRIQK